MQVGDLVVDDKSHMDPSNLFYDAFHRVGVVIGIGRAAHLPVGKVEVVWTNEKGQWTTFNNPDSLVVLNENR